jgi:hypothetical protein
MGFPHRLSTVLFVIALAGCRTGLTNGVPACATPAPLLGHFDSRAPGYFIKVRGPAQNFWPTASRLETEYSILVESPLPHFNMLQAATSPVEVARLRCDAGVEWVEYNAVVLAGGRG